MPCKSINPRHHPQAASYTTCSRRRRDSVWLVVMVLVCSGGALQRCSTATEAASLSVHISDDQLRMLRVLNILANAEHSHRGDGDDNDENASISSSSSSSDGDISNDDSSMYDGLNAIELSHRDENEYTLQLRPRQRHRKRQSLYVAETRRANELEWQNPCGGVFEDEDTAAEDRPSRRQYLSLVRDTAYAEYTVLTDRPHNITVSDIKEWKMHKQHYRFLPALNSNKIGLKHWYRKMQVYVAAFAYLGHAQHRWEQSKQLPTSATTRELNELLISARRILCELETAINGSYARTASQEKLHAFTRAEMDAKLNAFLTRVQQSLTPDVAIEPFTQDLKFAKYRYLKFLERMFTMLENNLKLRDEHIQFADSSGGSSAAAIDDNQSLSLHELVMRNNNSNKKKVKNNAPATIEGQQQQQQPSQQNAKQRGRSGDSHRRGALKSNSRDQQRVNQRKA